MCALSKQLAICNYITNIVVATLTIKKKYQQCVKSDYSVVYAYVCNFGYIRCLW